MSCNELNYSLIIILGKGCVQILSSRTNPLSPQTASSAGGGTEISILPCLTMLLYTLHQSKGQTLPTLNIISATCISVPMQWWNVYSDL